MLLQCPVHMFCKYLERCVNSRLERGNDSRCRFGITERYRKAGKRLRLRHLSPECQKMITTAGKLVVIEVAEDDPHYTVASI